MKTRNADVQKKIFANAQIFEAARRADVSMQIRSKMAEKGLKSVDIAERVGVSEANVSRWLRGNQNLSLGTIYQLADALEEPLHIVFGPLTQADNAGVASSHRSSNELESVSDIESAAPYTAESVGTSCTVVQFATYQELRAQTQGRGHKQLKFAVARSEYGIIVDDRMVN